MSDQRPNAIRVATAFYLWEFESPDTHTVMVDPELVYRLELLRMAWGSPLRLSSGYRTPAHNTAVDGLPHSKHLRGKGSDVPIVPEDAATTPPATAEWICARGWIPKSHVPLFVSIAQRVGFRRDQVVDEGDCVHLEVD